MLKKNEPSDIPFGFLMMCVSYLGIVWSLNRLFPSKKVSGGARTRILNFWISVDRIAFEREDGVVEIAFSDYADIVEYESQVNDSVTVRIYTRYADPKILEGMYNVSANYANVTATDSDLSQTPDFYGESHPNLGSYMVVRTIYDDGRMVRR